MYKQLGSAPFDAAMLERLKASDPNLYQEVQPLVQPDGKLRLSRELAQRLDDWLVKEATPPYVDPFHDQMRELVQRENKRLQTERDQKAGLARLEQYAVEQRLSLVQSNVDAIDQWLMENARGYWSAAGVDAAVRVLSAQGRLKFEPPPTVPKPAPQPKPWVKGDALPENATEEQLRLSTPDEIRAWMRRKRK